MSKELGDYTAARHVLNALDFPCCTLLHDFLHGQIEIKPLRLIIIRIAIDDVDDIHIDDIRY